MIKNVFLHMGLLLVLSGCGTYLVSYKEEFFLPTHQIRTSFFQDNDCYLGTENYFLHYRQDTSGWTLQKMLPISGCRFITAGPSNVIWIGGNDNLFEYRNQKLTPLLSSKIPVSKIFLSETQSFIFSEKKMFRLIQTKEMYELNLISSFSGKPIEVLFEDGLHYLVTEVGIYKILEQGTTKILYTFPEEILGSELTCALIQNGIFWIGSHQGLFSITTNFIQLKTWGLKSQILALSHIYSTIFCSTVDGLFRYTAVGYWENFPFIEFSPPKHLDSPYQLLFFAQKTPQSIYFLSAHYGILKLSLNNYQYVFEYFRPLLPDFQGRMMSGEHNKLYTQRGFVETAVIPCRFQLNAFEEDVLKVISVGGESILITQQGIRDKKGTFLWKAPERSFIQEVGVPLHKKSGLLIALTLGGFPEVSPARSVVFSITPPHTIEREVLIQVGPVRGMDADESRQVGYLLTDAEIYSFDWKRFPKLLPMGNHSIRGPFLAGLATENDFYLTTPEGLFRLDSKSETLNLVFPFHLGNIPITFLQGTDRSWCISSAGEIFLWEQERWRFLEKYTPQTTGLISFFCTQNTLYVHESQTDQVHFWNEKGRQKIQLPIPCSQIYFLGLVLEKFWIETPEALFSYENKKWQILYLRDIPSLDDKLFSGLK